MKKYKNFKNTISIKKAIRDHKLLMMNIKLGKLKLVNKLN